MQWVIKLGGSLYNSKFLTKWLEIIQSHNAQKIIIVPGGGPFADLVRDVDKQYGLEPIHAHNMAVLGMQQYAYMIASLQPEFKLVSTVDQIQGCSESSRIGIWEPLFLVQNYCELEKDWQMTSDSLAVWLANFLSINHLIYIKSKDIESSEKSLEELATIDYIDKYLPILARKYKLSPKFLYKSQFHEFRKLVKQH